MTKNITIYIDTSVTQEVVVAIGVDGKRYEKISERTIARSQAVLPLIMELLEEHSYTFADVKHIQVVTGPGSYTGLRVGCAIANALGLLLGVPVNDKHALAMPVYS
jgi:tRNA threonylcarbamoyladenosine biosynthesis protein TsaB